MSSRRLARPAYLGAGLVLAVVLLGGLSLPVGAQEYSGGATITVSDSTVEPGDPVTATAAGFQAGSTVEFTLFSDPVALGSATADAEGVASLTFTVPDSVPAGDHQLVASGIAPDGSPLQVATVLTVLTAGGGAADGTGSDGSSDGALARTGSDVDGLLRAGAVLLTFGAVLVLVVRRRARDTAPERATVDA